MSNINSGLSEPKRKEVAQGLAKILADSYTLYLKTHNFHWNVKGPQFQSLHLLFEKLYTELAIAVDDIAERIRALGFRAPASYAEFSKLTSVKEVTEDLPAEEMLKQLLEGQEIVTRGAREVFPIADRDGDEATMDLLTQRMRDHEKAAWMLRSHLER